MNLPKLSAPVSRKNIVSRNPPSGVNPSNIVCNLCCKGCGHLPGFLRGLCNNLCARIPGCHC